MPGALAARFHMVVGAESLGHAFSHDRSAPRRARCSEPSAPRRSAPVLQVLCARFSCVFTSFLPFFGKPLCFYRFLPVWETNVFLQVSAVFEENPVFYRFLRFVGKTMWFYRFLLFFGKPCVFTGFCFFFSGTSFVFTGFCLFFWKPMCFYRFLLIFCETPVLL